MSVDGNGTMLLQGKQGNAVRHFAADGSLAVQENDLDGDGRVDIRTRYREGRMVQREIMGAEAERRLR